MLIRTVKEETAKFSNAMENLLGKKCELQRKSEVYGQKFGGDTWARNFIFSYQEILAISVEDRNLMLHYCWKLKTVLIGFRDDS